MPQRVICVLPASFQAYTAGKRNVELSADNVRNAVDSLVLELPDLRPHLLDGAGKLRPFINLFVDSQQVLDLDAHPQSLNDGSELLIVAALAGG